MNKTERSRPFKLGIRWINNPTKLYYFNFETMARLKKVLQKQDWVGKYEWAAIYHNTVLIEEFKIEKGWQRASAT